MKRSTVVVFCLFLLACTGFAQQTPPAQAPATTPSASQNPAIDTALKAYAAAYAHKNMDELVAVWPDLPTEKKDYKKIQSQFGDSNISNVQMTLQPLETQAMTDSAVVQCQRTLNYVKEETRSESVSGDNRGRGIAGVQDQGPMVKTVKKDVKKTDKVWIKLHRSGDNWTIAAISDKPLVP
jgi:hypothetical protein